MSDSPNFRNVRYSMEFSMVKSTCCTSKCSLVLRELSVLYGRQTPIGNRSSATTDALSRHDKHKKTNTSKKKHAAHPVAALKSKSDTVVVFWSFVIFTRRECQHHKRPQGFTLSLLKTELDLSNFQIYLPFYKDV